MANVTRLSRDSRTGLRVAAVACWVLGALLFLGFVLSIQGSMGDSASPGFAGQASSPPPIVLPFLGVLLMGAGGFLGKFAFAKPASEILATETAGATQVAGAALGRGFREGFGAGGPAQVVRVKCRKCAFLESEDANFCSQCRTKL